MLNVPQWPCLSNCPGIAPQEKTDSTHKVLSGSFLTRVEAKMEEDARLRKKLLTVRDERERTSFKEMQVPSGLCIYFGTMESEQFI